MVLKKLFSRKQAREDSTTKRLGKMPTMSRRKFIGIGTAVVAAIAGGVGVLFHHQPPDIKAVISLTCSDSRHVGLLVHKGQKMHPGQYSHVANAGAFPGEDLEQVVRHLESQGLKRNQILVVGTSHWNPACGGAQVTPQARKALITDLEDFGFGKEKINRYLAGYGLDHVSVFKSVETGVPDRSRDHAAILKKMGVHYVTGAYQMDQHTFTPQQWSHKGFKVYSWMGTKLSREAEEFKHQAPENVVLSIPGFNGRGHPEDHQEHWQPGNTFPVSINPHQPSDKSLLSLIYYAHLTPKGEHGHGGGPRNVVLAGTPEQVKQLREFAGKDALIQHMVKEGKWIIRTEEH